jgi:uncharacterized protein (DUF2141 family)
VSGAALLLLVALFPLGAHAQAPDAGTTVALDVVVTGLREGGMVWVLLFDDAPSYPTKRDKARRRIDVVPERGEAKVSFEGLPPGDYAVAVVHDENGNGKLDFGLFRIPTEGLGASRDARALLGPPSFDDAKLHVEKGRLEVPIHLSY